LIHNGKNVVRQEFVILEYLFREYDCGDNRFCDKDINLIGDNIQQLFKGRNLRIRGLAREEILESADLKFLSIWPLNRVKMPFNISSLLEKWR